jgi:hypothetical protein
MSESLLFTESWENALASSTIWVTGDGVEHHLDSFDRARCTNILDFVLRTLPTLVQRDLMRMMSGPYPSGDMACDAYDRTVGYLEDILSNPRGWAGKQPLVQALRRRISGLPAEENESQEGTWMRKEHEIQAVRYDGTNADLVAALAPYARFSEGRTSTPDGPARAVTLWGPGVSEAVCVGQWLVLDDGKLRVVDHEDFLKNYEKGSE